MQIGFVGVGRLGRHLAASLVRAGFDVIVHDRDASRVQELARVGARNAASPADLAAEADAVITCLPSPRAVTSVIAGEDGVLSTVRAGSTWIEMSTNDRHELVRLSSLAAEHGVETLEAPVTGGVHRAASADITVLVGGDAALARRHMPLFEAMGGRVFHVGPLGSATDLKVITNMLAFVHLVAAGEALMLAKRAGLDLGRTYHAIRASSGNSFVPGPRKLGT